jgi:isopentenyl phosphate kinase
MKKQLILLKIGGSLITDKSSPRTARPSNMRFIAEQIAAAYAANPDADFIIGTGAGSFGHFTAGEYGLREGASTPEQFYGMAITHNAVRELSTMMAKELTDVKVPAFSLSPAGLLVCTDGAVSTRNLQPMDQLMAHRCVPLVHGDTMLDTTRGATILSTEQVLHECLATYKQNYEVISVIYLLDVDGLLDKNGEVIPELKAGEDITVLANLPHDVTGGIAGKVASAREAAPLASQVYLVRGMAGGALAKAIAGKNVGTRILA